METPPSRSPQQEPPAPLKRTPSGPRETALMPVLLIREWVSNDNSDHYVPRSITAQWSRENASYVVPNILEGGEICQVFRGLHSPDCDTT